MSAGSTPSAAAPLTPPGRALPPELRRALGRVTELGSLPEVTVRIVQVVEDPRATARQIHDVVRTDPALAAKLLKVVNSAFYGLPAQIASLERAILMLGLNAVKNLALATSLARLFSGERISERFDARDLWRHSVAVAVAARQLAQAAGFGQPDEAFVAGLMHDMGLIVAHQVLPGRLREVAERCAAEPQSFCAVEEQVYGSDHQAIGWALAAKWKFPPGLCHAIAYHHTPAALQPEHQKTPRLIYLADALGCRGRYGFWLSGQTHELGPEVLQAAGLRPQQLEQVAAELPQGIAEAEAIFGE